MTRSRNILFGLGLAIAASTPACMVSGSGTVGVSTTPVVVYNEPPADQVEAMPERPGYVWVKGRWDWRNGQWAWIGGRWEAAAPGPDVDARPVGAARQPVALGRGHVDRGQPSTAGAARRSRAITGTTTRPASRAITGTTTAARATARSPAPRRRRRGRAISGGGAVGGDRDAGDEPDVPDGGAPAAPHRELRRAARGLHLGGRSLGLAQRPVGVARRALGAPAREHGVDPGSLGASGELLRVDRGSLGHRAGGAGHPRSPEVAADRLIAGLAPRDEVFRTTLVAD